MRNCKKSILGKVLLLVAFLFACADVVRSEEQGAYRDHQFLPRLEGLTANQYDVKDYDEYVVPLGPLLKGFPDKIIKLEGAVTRILYNAHPKKSVFEVHKYYENLLKKNGFEIIYSASGEELGDKWAGVFYPQQAEVSFGKEQKFIAAKLPSKNGDVYVTVFATLGWRQYVTTEVDIIEPAAGTGRQAAEPVDTPVQNVSAAQAPAPAAPVVPDTSIQLEEKLKTDGFVHVKSIEFKEGSAEIKSGAGTTLKDMAAIVKRNPGLRFEIKVYTDSIGTAEYCKQLSDKRADSVLRSVILVHGADKTRVQAVGMGFSPDDSMGETGHANRVIFSIKQ